jgi:hypothetical protein
MALNRFSLVTTKLHLSCQQKSMSVATGFYYVHSDQLYLVSNWHVFSGRHPDTGQPLHSSSFVPDQVTHSFARSEDKQVVWRNNSTELFLPDGNVRWIQHPTLGQRVDIAALHVGPSKVFQCFELAPTDSNPEMVVEVGQDIFILGHPNGLAVQAGIPIWKRGSIATEPSLPISELDKFLVDSATREGMSGSPVLAIARGSYRTQTAMVIGSANRFLGVYSGRIGSKDDFGNQLGTCWGAKYIEEIITGQTPGDYQLTPLVQT